jgi:hypothetical protein
MGRIERVVAGAAACVALGGCIPMGDYSIPVPALRIEWHGPNRASVPAIACTGFYADEQWLGALAEGLRLREPARVVHASYPVILECPAQDRTIGGPAFLWISPATTPGTRSRVLYVALAPRGDIYRVVIVEREAKVSVVRREDLDRAKPVALQGVSGAELEQARRLLEQHPGAIASWYRDLPWHASDALQVSVQDAARNGEISRITISVEPPS